MNKNNSNETTDQLFYLLMQIQKKLLRPSELIIKSEISPQQFYTLCLLQESSLSRNDISKAMEISKQQLTPILDKLTAFKLIEKSNDPSDKRSMIISLTDKGNEFLETQNYYIKEYLSNKISILSKDDIDNLKYLAQKLNSIIDKI